jgi:hypothetical protein
VVDTVAGEQEVMRVEGGWQRDSGAERGDVLCG